MKILPKLQHFFEHFDVNSIAAERKSCLQVLIDYIAGKMMHQQPVVLNFICTHNSRRSQLAQIWAKTAAAYFDLDVTCLSGGVEVTAFNERAVSAVARAGFRVEQSDNSENPVYYVWYSGEAAPLRMFSKLFDDPENRADAFAAVMVCSHADANCPFIPGTEKRISLTYDDPKAFDGTDLEAAKYDERSKQIAGELFYVFSKVKNSIK